MLVTMRRRVRFLVRMALQSLMQDRRCPNCDCPFTAKAGRKWGVMQVRRCYRCGLMFRWPKDSLKFNLNYYQRQYVEAIVTDAPNQVESARLVAWGQGKVNLLRGLVAPGARVLDFGCSWGYNADLLRGLGYRVVGFEISRPRAAFGRRHFGLDILDAYDRLHQLPGGTFDAIFASHVLEHLPRIDGVLSEFARLVRPDGVVLILVPNCGDGRGGLRVGWKPIVGEKHPMAFDCRFFEIALPRYGFQPLVTTGMEDYEAIQAFLTHANQERTRDQAELVVLARRVVQVSGVPPRTQASVQVEAVNA
jgi:SAM-dependent methyltransferase